MMTNYGKRVFTMVPPRAPRFSLQYASNLHITRHDKPVFPLFVKPAARHLALVGDVGDPKHPHFSNFFTYAAQYWHTVIYAPNPQSDHSLIYDYVKHLQNVHILTNPRPFFLFADHKIALSSPYEDSIRYRKLIVLSYNGVDGRVYLENIGSISSHGINGESEKQVYVNSRGDAENPLEGFSTTSCITVL